jgi:hypothetical protein
MNHGDRVRFQPRNFEITFHTGNGHGDVGFLSTIHPAVTPTARQRLDRRILSGAPPEPRRSERFYGGMVAAAWSRLPWSSQTFKGNPRIAESPAALSAATHSG